MEITWDLIKTVLNKFFVTLPCVISLIFGVVLNPFDRYETAKEEPLFNGVIVADLHADGDPLRDRNNEVRKILAGVSASKNPIDAFAVAGDYSNAGAAVEKDNLEKMLAAYGEKGQILLQMGNHDSQATSNAESIDEAQALFRDFIGKYGIETDENYYYKEVNSVPFIVMGTELIEEVQEDNNAYYTQKQIDWLDASLEKASKTERPVFVITHQPLKGLNGIEDDCYNGVGSNAILNTIKKHTENGTTVVLVTGHYHRALSENTFDAQGKLYSINLPTVLEGSESNFDGNGKGIVVEVYEDTCIIRARDFIRNTWVEDYAWEIKY